MRCIESPWECSDKSSPLRWMLLSAIHLPFTSLHSTLGHWSLTSLWDLKWFQQIVWDVLLLISIGLRQDNRRKWCSVTMLIASESQILIPSDLFSPFWSFLSCFSHLIKQSLLDSTTVSLWDPSLGHTAQAWSSLKNGHFEDLHHIFSFVHISFQNPSKWRGFQTEVLQIQLWLLYLM